MAPPTVYVTRLLPAPIMDSLRQRYHLVAEPGEDDIPTPDDLRAGFAEADAVICMLSDTIDAELFSHARKLKIVANYAVGYNNIDLAAAKTRGIVVTNTPDVLTDATADLAWALLLAVARRVVEGDHLVRVGAWRGWAPTQLLGADIAGKTLGVIGMGRIGQAVAQRAQGFRMKVLYASRRSVSPPFGLSWEHCSIEQVLAEADFVSLHVPLTEATHHMIGPRELSLMKQTAILINTARGPVVDEEALVSALKAGTIAGAGLDVYEREPAVHPDLMKLPNVVLLPHLGSATWETRLRMGRICLDNIEAVLNGRPAPNRIV
ncbi:MAG: D-glycerate dehydrogenase [Nitrospira sp.]|nr:D-glycerate dehydrogenase [Nitrospira sp.]MCP9442593.1 D-glycerate dehydrogenase [Nitrospira sp.]